MASNIERATYTLPEAAERLGVSKATLYTKVQNLEWPHTRMIRTYSFTEDDIQAILAMSRVEPATARVTRNRKAS